MASIKLAWLLVASGATSVLAQTTLAAPYNGFSYLGCYSDNSADRALANQSPPTPGGSNNMTIQNCIDTCGGTYSYVGLEFYYECWCANTLNTDSVKEAEGDCSYACRGDNTEICGGSSRLSVYAVQGASGNTGSGAQGPIIPQDIGSGYTYVNCYADTNDNRAVFGSYYNGNIALEACAANCASIADANYLGMDYYGECFCGSTLNTAGGTSNGCTLPCYQNSSEFCGGINAAQVYQRINPAAAAAASRASVTSYKSASRSSVTSSRSAFSAEQAASRASVTSSREALSTAQSASRSSVTSSKSAFSASVAASRSSVTSSKQAASNAQSASRSSVSSSKSVFSEEQAASRASVTSSQQALSNAAAASRASVTSSRSVVSASVSSSRSSASSSRSSANSLLSSSRAAASSSRSSADSSVSSSQYAASISKSSYASYVSSSKASASSSKSSANYAISASRSSANSSLSSVRSAEAAAKASSTMTTSTTKA